jgi:hypothetical protein
VGARAVRHRTGARFLPYRVSPLQGIPLTGYPRSALIFLLPRVSRLGWWAPVLNATLFALYHLWTPWQAATRIISILLAAYVVQRTKNIYAYMWVHCTLNTVGILLTLAALLAGIRP